MQYYITIQDVENLADPLVLKSAEMGSVNLTYNGGDDKTQPIVGSKLSFSLMVENCERGKYDKYFTTDEQKWLVRLYIDETDELVWKGFLLPETYSEPLANGTFFVDFAAVDGLGLLKGKYLPDKYYEKKEYPVTEFITEILALTGLDFQMFFSPALEPKEVIGGNPTNGRKWDFVYLSGHWFKDEEGKRDSAYDILKDIVYSMRCQVYQSDGRWFCEGIQKRLFIDNEYWIYNTSPSNQTPTQTPVKWSKPVKELTYEAFPNYDLIPPYKEVKVSHKKEGFELPDGLVSPEKEFNFNEGTEKAVWFPDSWQITEDYQPMFKNEESNLYFKNDTTTSSNWDLAFNLKYPVVVFDGNSFDFKISFQLVFADTYTPTDADAQTWLNSVVYEVILNGNVIFTNNGLDDISDGTMVYDNSGSATAEKVINIYEDGLLDLKIHNPTGLDDTKILGVKLTSIELKPRFNNDDIDKIYSITIDKNASATKEIDLPIAQDITNKTPNFQLEKWYNKRADTRGAYVGKMYQSFQFNGDTYYSVDIAFAKLIDDFIGYLFVFKNSTPYEINNYEVIYNFQGGDMFVIKNNDQNPIKDPDAIFAILYTVQRIDFTKINQWQEWTNSLYKISNNPFLEVVANIEKEMNEVEASKIEGNALNPIKYNDIIRFKYKGKYQYFNISDVSWDLSNGLSSVILQQCMYDGNSFGNIPPYVDAGDDIILDTTDTNGQPAPTIFDPDGFITNYQWTKVSGQGGNIINPNDKIPTFDNLTPNENYTFKVDVTDNSLNLESDTVDILWNLDTLMNSNLVVDNIGYTRDNVENIDEWHFERKWDISYNPSIANRIFKLFYQANLDISSNAIIWARVVINGNFSEIDEKIDGLEPSKNIKGNITTTENNTLSVELHARAIVPAGYQKPNTNIFVKFNRIENLLGCTKITNLPVTLDFN